jgi:hypothetical protein
VPRKRRDTAISAESDDLQDIILKPFPSSRRSNAETGLQIESLKRLRVSSGLPLATMTISSNLPLLDTSSGFVFFACKRLIPSRKSG